MHASGRTRPRKGCSSRTAEWLELSKGLFFFLGLQLHSRQTHTLELDWFRLRMYHLKKVSSPKGTKKKRATEFHTANIFFLNHRTFLWLHFRADSWRPSIIRDKNKKKNTECYWSTQEKVAAGMIHSLFSLTPLSVSSSLTVFRLIPSLRLGKPLRHHSGRTPLTFFVPGLIMYAFALFIERW